MNKRLYICKKNQIKKLYMKSNKYQYKLIEGDFSTEEAKKVLLSLINNKIDYHNLNAFSDFIRNNESLDKSKNRILELTKTREAISLLISEAKKSGLKLNIKSYITIELI